MWHIEGVLLRATSAQEVLCLLAQDAEERREWMRGQHAQAQSEEESELAELLRETTLLFAVAIYHAVENTLYSIFQRRLSGLDEIPRQRLLREVHKWEKLKQLTTVYFHVRLDSLKGARQVNVLRLIANAAKHLGGRVSAELAGATGWQKGQPIAASDVDLTNLHRRCIVFIVEFVKAAEKGTRKLFGEPPSEDAG